MKRTILNTVGLAACLTLLATVAPAQMMQSHDPGPLGRLATSQEALSPPASVALLDQGPDGIAANVTDAWSRFQSEAGGTWVGYVDRRSGYLEFAEGSGWPWIPGAGNTLSEADIASFLGASRKVDLAAMDRIARAFLPQVGSLLGVEAKDLKLSEGRSGPMSDYLWYVDYDVYRGGWKIEGARVMFRINHGNLVQFGSEGVPPPGLAVAFPRLSREEAVQAVASYIGGFSDLDALVDPGTLKMMTRAKIDPTVVDRFRPGDGYGLLPVWQLSFRRKGTVGTWRARVDALDGRIVEFGDVNEYAQAKEGVVLVQPSLGETSKPMPFTNISTGGFTNSAGVYTPVGAATSSMNGQFVRLVDSCGAISLAADGSGNFDFGTSPASDCSTPGFGGAGNTRSSRTQFYWVNRVKEVGRGWLPGVAWLSNQLTTNVNINQVCNAYWNGSTINFFRSGGGCGNTGELPGVSLHEYGHGLDSNDGTGSPPENGSGETVGDWTAALATHLSCIGPGFQGGNCGGYGNLCTACTGVRDIDWAKRVANIPSTVQNFTQIVCPQPNPNNPNYVGPCGANAIANGTLVKKREGHCESYISSQALWDLANRDLPSPGSGGAWSISDRLWYLTRATTTSFFACNTVPAVWTSDGCAAGTLFRTFRVADDDDGNLANGTPHGGAIFAAFDRHNIACTTDPGANVTFAACTIPTPPTLSLIPSQNTMLLSWTSSGPETVYDVYRNELDCNAGFVKIANDVEALSLADTSVANTFNYNYQVITHPAGTEACGAPPSNCASAVPVPCTAPGSPIIGTATPTAPNQITVSWTNGAPPATHFKVYRARGTCAVNNGFSLITPGVTGTVTGTSYLDTTVSGGITYAYQISGAESTGVCESPQTTCVEATATGACVEAPTFAGATGVANNASATCGLTASWAAGSPVCAGPLTYDVYRSTNAFFTPSGANLLASGVSGTSYVDSSPLAFNTTYYYVVRARDSSNGVEDTNVVRRSATPTGPIPITNLTDTFEAAGGFDIPGWTHAAVSGANDWVLSTAQSQTPTHSWFSDSTPSPGERVLVSPSFQAQVNTTLSFFHTFAFEFSQGTCWDGGTIEYTTNGTTWTTMPDANFTAGLFNGTINGGNPIGAVRGYCAGTIGAMTQVSINLGSFAGQTLRIRWREGDDDSVEATGWFIDSVNITNAGLPTPCSPSGATGSDYFTLTPCRILDTRDPASPLGGPSLAPGATRTFVVAGTCTIPPTANALALNVTVVSPTAAGDLRIYPSDVAAPLTSAINFGANQTRTNNGVVTLPAGGSQGISIFNESAGSTDVILDVFGYFQ
jgi:trimeric autotransporter adhesin